jgi:hypothetical protein
MYFHFFTPADCCCCHSSPGASGIRRFLLDDLLNLRGCNRQLASQDLKNLVLDILMCLVKAFLHASYEIKLQAGSLAVVLYAENLLDNLGLGGFEGLAHLDKDAAISGIG